MNFLEKKNKLLTSTTELIEILDNPKFEGYSNTVKNSVESFNDEIQKELIFKVLCLGEFNAGKSTFLNNFFLEENILPTGVIPTTAKITTIKYGEKKELTIVDEKNETHSYQDNISDILKSSISVNGYDLESTKEVLLTIPSNVLKDGVVIVDTAGLNDSDTERSSMTLNFVEEADAVIFLLRAGQPWSESEKDFLEEKIFIKKDLNKIFFVINYWDTLETEDERNEVLTRISEEINKSLSKLEASDGISKKLELFTISAKTGENFDKLKTELFKYLEQTKEEEILNQKVVTLNTRLFESIKFLENQKEQVTNEDLNLNNEKEKIFNELKEFNSQKEEFEYKVTKKLDSAYENFLENIEQESATLKGNMIKELDEKISKNNDVKIIKNIIETALKKSQRKSEDNFRKISIKFKKDLNDILSDEKTTLNLRTSKLMDDKLLFNKEDQEIILDKRNEIPEDFVALAGLGALGGTGILGYGLATAATTTANQGMLAAAWAFFFGGVTTTAGISATALATGGLAVLALAAIPTYIYLKEKSIKDYQKEIDGIVGDIDAKFEENMSNLVKSLVEQKEKTIELILKNINNDIIESYENKIKEYENMQEIKSNPEKTKELDNLINKLNLLKV